MAADLMDVHKRGPRPTHCDACCTRWPCDTYDIAECHERLLAAAEQARDALGEIGATTAGPCAEAYLALQKAIDYVYGDE
jgi:hypothetical protein